MRASRRVLLSSAQALAQLLVTLLLLIFEAFNLWGIAFLTDKSTRLSRILIRLMAAPWMRETAFGQFWFDHIIPRLKQSKAFPLATAKILRLLPVTESFARQRDSTRVKRRVRASS